MAKRFGRNQKRRLREQVEKLSKDNHWLTLKSANLESRLVQWARSMNHYLGSYHPLNERVHRMMIQRTPHVYDRYRFMQNTIPSIKDMDYALGDVSISTKYINTVLHVIDVHRNEIRPEIIVELISSDNKHYYAIDEDYLKSGRRDPRFVQYLSDQIAEGLSAHLTK